MFIPSLATGIEQVLPLVIILLIFLALKWMQRSRAEDTDTSADNQQKRSEESMRKLLEALGLPENALPPPLVLKNPPETSAHSAAHQEPPVPSPPLPAVPDSATKIHVAATLKARVAASQRATRTSKPAKETRKKAMSGGLERLQKELRNPHCLRRAIVLREILGLPKAYDRSAPPSHW